MEPITTALGLILVNLVLSGDNAVVIGMAAHKLEKRQRLTAIIFGGVAAIVLRIAFTGAAAFLMRVPALQFIGGALLVWIAFKLLGDVGGGEETHKAAGSMWEAIWIITIADVVMSLDNILALAGVSRGDWSALVIGLAMSMPIVLFAGGIVAELINRFPWINYVGAIVIAYVAGEMMLQDHLVAPFVPETVLIEKGVPILLAIAIPVIATLMNRRSKARETALAMEATPVATSAEHDA